MKKFLFIVMVGSLLFHSCSSDSVESSESLENSSHTQRLVQTVYPQFTTLFTSIYSRGAFVSNTQVTRVEGGITHKLTEVYTTSAMTDKVGIFDETGGTVTYYADNKLAKTITIYTPSGTGYASFIADVSGDPIYTSNGLNPNITIPGNTIFGWGAPYLSDECINGHRYWYEDYRLLGVRLKTRSVFASDGSALWTPC